jgi:hypothetical protein
MTCPIIILRYRKAPLVCGAFPVKKFLSSLKTPTKIPLGVAAVLLVAKAAFGHVNTDPCLAIGRRGGGGCNSRESDDEHGQRDEFAGESFQHNVLLRCE